MGKSHPSTVESNGFEDDARQSLVRLREAFAALLENLPERAVRAHEVSKTLGIHRKLGWQIANLVYEPDPLAAAQHLPGRASIRKFLNAVARHKVDAELLRTAEDAVGNIDRLIEVHAGDRESLNLMLTGSAGEAARKADLAQRRAAFQAGSYIWGVQVQTSLASVVLWPSAEREGCFDLAQLAGFVGFRRMRSNVSWPLRSARQYADDGSATPQPVRIPLDGNNVGSDEPPLLTRFCSQPPPGMRRRTGPDRMIIDELLPGPTGNTGAIDCFIGELCRAAGHAYRTEHESIWGTGRRVRTPAQVLILDQFVHEDLFGVIDPKVCMYRDLPEGPPLPVAMRDDDRMPVFETVQHLGKGLSGIRTPDVPRYAEMISYVFERLGWEPSRFRVVRARVEYPPVPTTVSVEYALPEKPEHPKLAGHTERG